MTTALGNLSELRDLARAYPAFSFSREAAGRRGGRWVAVRHDRTATGLSVVITGNVMELHAALRRDKARHAR